MPTISRWTLTWAFAKKKIIIILWDNKIQEDKTNPRCFFNSVPKLTRNKITTEACTSSICSSDDFMNVSDGNWKWSKKFTL